ncbi:hypothetical protein E8D34_10790 [Nocardioides sp. GY 10113]|uniref:hypothetical protein n=1 Tax=Nocardioides sp. GY 10113 TaxID=2569761 RepID=UPI0010A7DA99|nr:hypothetical protein [Nocardioides sp. GY 10113]TIC86727.1 hypothetical protein E8D34_10790 [Nocardioides sp. GY 10113]
MTLQRWTSAAAGCAVAAAFLLVPASPSAARPQGDSAAAEALTRAAGRAGLSVGELRERIDEDPTLEVTDEGRLRFAERALSAAEAAAPAPQPQAVAGPGETFALHSNPGAARTILLDFDGQRVADTAWNASGLPATTHPAWDPAGDGAAFSPAERTLVQDVWRRVAEDFAPFDVDVTTEDPGSAGLDRSSSSDQVYGVRMLITPSAAAQEQLCSVCGGLAYLDIFDLTNNGYRIGWVFTGPLQDNAKYIADAAAHEAGHTLGLSHDGKDDDAYDDGHGAWAPIMGAGYLRPVTHFSNGDYPGATNAEDDVALLTDQLGLRADEAGAGVADAAPLGGGTGTVTTRQDRDTFALGECTGPVAVTATPAETGANLDLRLSLLDETGAVLDSDDPAVTRVDSAVASGLGARVGVAADAEASASYYVRVDGVGYATPATGYSDYGSIGDYRIAVTGSCTGGAGAPGVSAETLDAAQVAAARVRLRAPRRARAWTRPTVRVAVRRTGDDGLQAASGRVRIRFGGQSLGTVRLDDGVATIRLPRLAPRRSRPVLRVAYRGNASTEAAHATKRLRVVRRR